MKALCWIGGETVRVEDVPEPKIINPRDAIVKVSSTAICGSDRHLFDGYIPTMQTGDILGHEFMGEVVELGAGVSKRSGLKVGDRVLVPFAIACGNCFFCQRQLWSLCDNSNPNGHLAAGLYGYTPAGLFGYSHMMGGYAGGQAEYVRVPYADVGCFHVPAHVEDEQVLFLTDILPTAYQAAEQCGIQSGDTVVVWGCGPVGLLTIMCALHLGAARVIAIDNVSERLAKAQAVGAMVIDYDKVHVLETLQDLTGGMGPDACIDAVGLEAHGASVDAMIDRTKAALWMATDRPHVLREAIQACRKGGIVSIPGVYGGLLDKLNFGAAFNKGLTFKMGQTHVHRYVKPLMEKIERGELDARFIITHRLPLSEAPRGYDLFCRKKEGCVKVVLKP
jgi:threonine dehydrogenase-like Zn-dependent dehydrogenase